MNSVYAIHWRLRLPRYRLVGSLCERCGQPVFPSRRLCPHCPELVWDKLPLGQQEEAMVILMPLESGSYSDR